MRRIGSRRAFPSGSRYGVQHGAAEIETTAYEKMQSTDWRRFLLDSYGELDRAIVTDRRVCDAL